MATTFQTIDYKPEPVKDPAAGIEVAEFTPYKGLEPFFTSVMVMDVTPAQRSLLTLMLLELDNGLQSYERGDTAQAVRHHKSMLEHSKAALKDAPAAAQQLFVDITSAVRGVKNADGSEKPWGRTLSAIVDEFKRGQEAENNLSLMPKNAQTGVDTFYASPRQILRVADKDYFNLDFTVAAERVEPKPVAWVRHEYRNLGVVLEQMSQPGQPARVDALVALSSLRTMNRHEGQYVSDVRNKVKNDGSENNAYKESRKRLQQAVAKLLVNDKVGYGMQSSLERWQKPVYDYAKRFERISEGPSLIARAFHAAASFFTEHMLPKALHASPEMQVQTQKFFEPKRNP